MAAASLVVRVGAQVAEFEKAFTSATRTAQKFEKDFAGTASSVSQQQKRMNDAFNAFSGDKVAREADAVAKAVEKAGGAARLTAQEQARVNSVMTEAIAKYQALGAQAPKSILDLEAATRKVVTATTELPKQLSLAEKATSLLSGAFGQFTAAGLATKAISAATVAIGDFVAKGAQLRGVEASFERLSTAAKQSGGDLLGSMRTATRGMVQDIDLMLGANKALLLGLPVTTDSMGELANAATVLGRAMGKDATSSLDDLITALGRSSPLILDNLGLTVKVGEANEAYASKLGKTAESLTDSERKTAFYEAAMEAARKKAVELGQVSKTLGEILQTAFTSAGNVITRFASNVNIGIGSALNSMKDFALFAKELAQFGAGVAISNAALREQMRTTAAAAKATEQNTLFTRDFVKELKKAGLGSMQLTGEYKKQYDAAVKLGVSEEDLAKRFGISAFQQKLLVTATKDATKERKSFASVAGDMVDRIEKEAAAHHKNAVALGRVQASLREFTTAVARQELDKQMRVLDEATQHWIDYEKAIRGVGVPITTGFGLGNEAMKDWLPDIKERLGKAFDGSEGDVARKAGLEFGSRLSQGIIGAIQGGGNIGATIGAIIGEEIGEAIGKKLSVSLSKSLGDTLGGAIGGAIGPIGAVLGGLLGKAIGNIGGPSKEELLGRDVVSAFENQLAGTLSVQQKLATGNVAWKNTTVAVRDAYIAAGKTVAEAEAAVTKLWNSSRQGSQAASLAVLEIQNVMDIARQKSSDAAAAEQSAMEASKKAAEEAKFSYSDLVTVADRYKIEVNSLGDAVNGLRVSETAQQAVKDWELMARAGADMNVVAKGMQEEMQGLVLESLKWGHALPESMRPILDKMKDMGLLTDDAGEKLTDLDKLKWEKPLGDAIDSLVDKMGVLIDTINNGLSGALQNIPNTIRARTDVTIDVEALGGGGIVRRPTLALVGEAGPEAVVPLGNLSGTVGGSDKETRALLESIDAKMGRLPDTMFRAMRDANQLRTTAA